MCEGGTPPCSVVLLLAPLSWVIFAAHGGGILGDNGMSIQGCAIIAMLGHIIVQQSKTNQKQKHSNCQNKKHVESTVTTLQCVAIARLVYQTAHVISKTIQLFIYLQV